ncbi:HNH endonuclease [Butyrivibrio sp. AC2005]|uniref:HNH endonuclease n=1 Tax=Butyrivibrio sp. AC2005 TaxID=1280672 RepID=UPI0009DC4286
MGKQCCGVKGPGAGGTAKLEVDHIIPFSQGGSDDDSNLRVLCEECNGERSDRYVD